MKLGFVLGIFALVLAGPARAEESDCARLARFAGTIMELHQNRVPLADVLALTDDPILTEIVLDAYDSIRFSTEGAQQRAVSDFRDRWHLACLRAAS